MIINKFQGFSGIDYNDYWPIDENILIVDDIWLADLGI